MTNIDDREGSPLTLDLFGNDGQSIFAVCPLVSFSYDLNVDKEFFCNFKVKIHGYKRGLHFPNINPPPPPHYSRLAMGLKAVVDTKMNIPQLNPQWSHFLPRLYSFEKLFVVASHVIFRQWSKIITLLFSGSLVC